MLRAIDTYTGHWRSDTRQARDGRAFHFEYDLAWMDAGRTIVRMVIQQRGPGERSVTVFEGYKGREPSGEAVYYFAASPAGRASRGEVVLEGDSLVTLYRGWTADGPVVHVRDVFGPVEDGTFTSTTYLRDRWTRTGAG